MVIRCHIIHILFWISVSQLKANRNLIYLKNIQFLHLFHRPFQNCDFDSLDMSQEGCSFVSQEAKDLICAMLNKTPEKRIKIKDIMNTPWISVSL